MLEPRSHGLWQHSAPEAPRTEALSGEVATDVAIIGGGFTGLSSALHLAEAGARVVVLEAAEIGFGGSGRNMGLVNAGMWIMPDRACDALGPEHGERVLDVLGRAPSLVFDLIARHGIACEAVRNGTLHLAAGRAGIRELEARCEQWSRRGAPVRMLTAAETASAVGTTRYRAALRDDRAGTIQPLAYARGLARAAAQAGARIFTRSAVTTVERVDGKWRLGAAAGGVRSDWVIAGTNAYSDGLFPALREEFVPLPYFLCATRPLGDNTRRMILPDREGAWDTGISVASFRTDAAGRLIFGSVGAFGGAAGAVHRAHARRALARLFPVLGPVEFEFEWHGQIAKTRDNLPRYHELAPQVLSFNGYNGRGIGPGTMFGKILAGRIVGPPKDLPLPPTPPDLVPFRALRAAAFELGSALIHVV